MTTRDDASDTEAQGIDRRNEVTETSRRTFLKAAGVGTAGLVAGSSLFGQAAAAGIPTPWLSRDGNLMRDPQGNKVIMRGVNTVDPYRAARDAPYYKLRVERQMELATDESNGWYTRIVRIPMQPNDIARQGAGSVPPGAFSQEQLDSYLRKYVDPAVAKAAELGIYVILDYHRHWPDGPQWDNPDLHDEVINFWNTVAGRYGGNSHVLYEVFNEPTEPYNGAGCQRNCPDVTDPGSEQTWLDWRETAQPWVDEIRNHAPRAPILIGSPRWSQWTWWAPKHEFEGDNLGYVGHAYTQDGLRPLSTYFGEPATEVPVWMTEFGWGGPSPHMTGTTEEHGPEFGGLFDEYDIHWQAWAFDFDWNPAMLTRDYTVAEGWGTWVKDRLAAKKDANIPSGSAEFNLHWTDGTSSEGGTTTATETTTTEGTPTSPTSPADQWTNSVTATTIELGWDAVSGATGYRVYVDGSQVAETTATAATITGLSPETSYEVGLTAYNGAGESPMVTTTVSTVPEGSGSATPGRVGSNTALPNDPDGDGLYEDVNGNTRQDIADAVDLFRNRESVDAEYFDFNESGGMSIGDAVSLFRENTG